MDIRYVCAKCEKLHDPKDLSFRCECGGLFNLESFDFDFKMDDIEGKEWSLFRYIRALPIDEDSYRAVTMGEGLTPVVALDPKVPDVMVKVDFTMPTLSFKDRGAAVLMAVAKQLGVKKVIQDSSGNAGNSIAAYAARAGISCDIYVPEGTSQKKIRQIESHGAKVNIVAGSREDTAKAALRAAENKEGFYASHVYNPFFYQGTKTYVYEVLEQVGYMPEVLFIPTGNGTLLLGCYYGLLELKKNNLIEKLPQIIAVQSQNCAPIYKAFIEGVDSIEEVENTGTLAEGIAITNPLRGQMILEAIRDTGGEIIVAPEDRINDARRELAERGFYVEPTTAATFAGYLSYAEKKEIKGRVLIPLCGAGLKKD